MKSPTLGRAVMRKHRVRKLKETTALLVAFAAVMALACADVKRHKRQYDPTKCYKFADSITLAPCPTPGDGTTVRP